MTADESSLGTPDVQTVTKEGRPTVPTIEGVGLRTPPVHMDHRGALFEIFNDDADFFDRPVVYAYQTSVFPGQLKGWARHEIKVDRYSISSGELIVLLYDDRADSPTRGVLQRVAMGDRGVRQIKIPVGVWHLIINPGEVEAQFINFPTEVYHHEQPDRILLPWDSTELPVDVKSYLRKF